MSEHSQSVILEHLEHIRGKVDDIGGQIGNFEVRILSLEGDFLTLAKSEASRNIELQAMTKRLTRLESRIAKLERGQRPAPRKSKKSTD